MVLSKESRRGARAPGICVRRSVVSMAAVAGMAVAGGAWAQANASTPRPFVEDRRQQERERALRQQQEAVVDERLQPGTAPDAAQTLPEQEAPCFRIDRITLDGEEAGSFAWLIHAADGHAVGLSDSPLGRCLGTQGINIVLARLQQALVSGGWITTRVLAAPQDLSGGTLALTLVPGRVAAIRFSDDQGDKTSLRSAMAIRPGELLNLRGIEQGLENLKRLPTAEADIQIEPAGRPDARPGDSDLVVKYQQRFPLRATLSLDDSGSKAMGKNQAGVTVAWDNPLGLNDLGLKEALLAALVNSIAATTANGIGNLTGDGKPLNDFTNKVAHFIAGCALGAAHAGNSGGCAGGALGATMGEMMAEAMGKSGAMDAFYSDNDKVYLAGLMGGLATSLAGGDADQVATASWAGSNAAANNYLTHKQLSAHATKEQQQTQSLANNAKVEDACLGQSAQTCTGAIAKVADDIVDLRAYRNELLAKKDVTTDSAAKVDLAYQITVVDKQIDSAQNAIRVGGMALNGGNYELGRMSEQELTAMGFAFDPLGAAELKAAGKTNTSLNTIKDNVGLKAEQAKAQIEQNARRDDAQQYDSYRQVGSTRPGGQWDWGRIAPNNGAVAGTERIVTVPTGTVVDRFGSTSGAYLSPSGVPYEARSLAPGSRAEPYSQYEVLKPFIVEQAQVAPAFGEVGLGIQYRIPEVSGRKVTVQDLIDNHYLGVK